MDTDDPLIRYIIQYRPALIWLDFAEAKSELTARACLTQMRAVTKYPWRVQSITSTITTLDW